MSRDNTHRFIEFVKLSNVLSRFPATLDFGINFLALSLVSICTNSVELLGIARAHKDVEGTGQESAAQGDPRVTARRSAVAALIANKKGDFVGVEKLEALSANVKNDIKWLKAAERADYSIDGRDDQFSWAKSAMSNSRSIQKEFKRRATNGKKQAAALQTGKRKSYDAADGSVIGMSFLTDPNRKADALVDTLLQFRARTDLANQEEKSWGDANTRMDLIGPSLVAEQRILLSTATLDADDPAKAREYALLRQVIASHPTSTVNGIFDARNAVGALFMDGADNYSDKSHTMAWIKEETPPGASTSAYKAIHHNFSRDTPKNIELMISEWIFPKDTGAGSANKRATARARVFSGLVDAMRRAEKGDVDSAKNVVEDLKQTNSALIDPLLDRLKSAPDDQIAEIIETYVSEDAVKPLVGSKLEERLEQLAKLAKNNKIWRYNTSRKNLEKIGGKAQEAIQPLLDQLATTPANEAKSVIENFISNLSEPLPTNLRSNLDYFARLYRSVCSTQPTARTLEKNLFRAGPAWREIADVIAQIKSGNDISALQELGEARLMMRDSIIGAETGYERHERIMFDSDLSRLTCTELGAAVDRVGNLKTDTQKAEALIAVQTALRSAIASGLHEIKDPDDPASSKGRPLNEVLTDVDASLSKGKIDEKAYRGLMSEVYVSVARTVQNMRAYVDSRAGAVANAGAELDPEFMDQLVKTGPLHYATALSEKGMARVFFNHIIK